jgi:hypothetical protein
MASNDLGPAPVIASTPATADDAIRGDAEVRSTGKGSVVELNAKPVAPDQFDDRYETGKYELWAYYSYYIGNNVSLAILLSAFLGSGGWFLWAGCGVVIGLSLDNAGYFVGVEDGGGRRTVTLERHRWLAAPASCWIAELRRS